MQGIISQTNLAAYKRKGLEMYRGLSAREKAIVWVAVVIAAALLLGMLYDPIASAFDAQTKELQQAEAQARRLPEALREYSRLAELQSEIEARYKKIEFADGVRSHLERLIIEKAGVAAGFQIREQPAVDFGAEYRQEAYNVKLSTTNLPKLVEFLDELVNGQRPLMLTKLEIRKTARRGGELDVDLDVGAIRRISETSPQA